MISNNKVFSRLLNWGQGDTRHSFCKLNQEKKGGKSHFEHIFWLDEEEDKEKEDGAKDDETEEFGANNQRRLGRRGV